MQMRYPPNFTRSEFLASQTATRLSINNEPSNRDIEENLVSLAWFLQSLRDRLQAEYGKVIPIIITSGFRSNALNIAIGGSKKSAHSHGLAADFKCLGLTTDEVCRFIHKYFGQSEFDQCIDEFGDWVHLGIKRPATNETRRQFLLARKVAGETRYSLADY